MRVNPVVFITGASSGIGAAACSVFAEAGYDVVLGARRKDKLESIAAEIRGKYPAVQAMPAVCDVDSDASVDAAFALIRERFGKLDVLANNAGYGAYGSVEETPLATFRANMETNFFGTIRCTKAALPLLRAAATGNKARWGAAIVMVSSFVGRRSFPHTSAYCATKFALEGLSESLRVELWDERISVSVVNPGVTQTEFFDSASGTRPSHFMSPGGGMTSRAAAEYLLAAVKRPRRNRYLSIAGKAGMCMQRLMPGVFDRVLVRRIRKKK